MVGANQTLMHSQTEPEEATYILITLKADINDIANVHLANATLEEELTNLLPLMSIAKSYALCIKLFITNSVYFADISQGASGTPCIKIEHL